MLWTLTYFSLNIFNIPCGKKNYCAMCHNLKSSLTIIIDDGDQYFKKKIMSKNLHNATCQILIDGWQLMTSWVKL
jgi:hypothetical protein